MSVYSQSRRALPKKADYFAGRAGGNDDPANRRINSIVCSTVKVPVYLPPCDQWISVDALLLLGCVRCSGYDSEKASVFHRVVAPQQQDVVTITDTDLKEALRFMISTATILEEMERDFIEHPSRTVKYEKYERRIRKYKPTFDGIMLDFEESIFGLFYNRRARETFVEILAHEGWKYFALKNLNELFFIMKERYGIDENELSSDDGADEKDELSQLTSMREDYQKTGPRDRQTTTEAGHHGYQAKSTLDHKQTVQNFKKSVLADDEDIEARKIKRFNL